MRGFYGSLLDLVALSGCREIHEVGCGEGYLTVLLGERGYRVRGSDASEEILEKARRLSQSKGLSQTFGVLDICSAQAAAQPKTELLICCEVLEHVEDPQAALRNLCGIAGRRLILSVPQEPLWRALNVLRLKYLRDLGNTPGHVQHFSRASFLALLEKHAVVHEVRTPLPWTMALCSPKAS